MRVTKKVLSQLDDLDDEGKFEAIYNAIRNEEEAILASEGPNEVRGIFYSSLEEAGKARMIEAEHRVRVKGRQAIEVEVMRAQGAAQVKALFERDPNCVVCSVPIESLGQASIFTPTGGKDLLVHTEGPCFEKMLLQSIGRYAGRGRGAVVRSVES